MFHSDSNQINSLDMRPSIRDVKFAFDTTSQPSAAAAAAADAVLNNCCHHHRHFIC